METLVPQYYCIKVVRYTGHLLLNTMEIMSFDFNNMIEVSADYK